MANRYWLIAAITAAAVTVTGLVLYGGANEHRASITAVTDFADLSTAQLTERITNLGHADQLCSEPGVATLNLVAEGADRSSQPCDPNAVPSDEYTRIVDAAFDGLNGRTHQLVDTDPDAQTSLEQWRICMHDQLGVRFETVFEFHNWKTTQSWTAASPETFTRDTDDSATTCEPSLDTYHERYGEAATQAKAEFDNRWSAQHFPSIFHPNFDDPEWINHEQNL